MNAPLRRGACPTLAAPMQTGDGLLARLNPVASGLSPDQLTGLCQAAARHGNGIVEITARGSLQIRGLTAASARGLAAEVDALDIAVRAGVPVETGPLAGMDPDEIADPRPLATRIRNAIATSGLEKHLGPKVSVVVDGGGHSALDGVAADVRLTAGRVGDGLAWRLAVAGDSVAAIQVADYAVPAASDAALAVLEAIAALGREGRARDLSWQALRGVLVEIQRSTLPPSVLPDICPTVGEIGRPLGFRQSTMFERGEIIKDSAISAVGEMSGRTEGGNVERQLSGWEHAFGITLPLTDGRVAVTVALPFGHIHADHLADFIQRSQTLGATEIRLAPRRALILLCPSDAAAAAIREAAGLAGLIIGATDARAHIAACPGAPACASGHIPARELAAGIARTMPAGSGLDLHVSGCAKRCARPGHKGLTLLGFPDGVGLALESASREPLAMVAKERAAAAIGRVAALAAAEGRTGETQAACLARIGKDKLTQAFEQDTR